MRRWGFLLTVPAFIIGVLTIITPRGVVYSGVVDCAQRNCDANGDGDRDISDAIRILGTLFLGDPPLAPYCQGVVQPVANGDCNGDGSFDISDAVSLLSWLFTSGPPPAGDGDTDTDADGVPDARDNCPLDSNPTQEDSDGDGVGNPCDACPGSSDLVDGDADGFPDGCDNCPLVANDQTDSDQDGTGDACEPPGGTYAGSLRATRGRWAYVPGMVGLAGANALCMEKFPGSQVCTSDQLLEAAAAGELEGATDFNGTPVTSYWVHRLDAPGNRQCLNPTENIPWTYQTAHINSHGESAALNPDGTLGEITLVTDHCQGQHWVACCNP